MRPIAGAYTSKVRESLKAKRQAPIEKMMRPASLTSLGPMESITKPRMMRESPTEHAPTKKMLCSCKNAESERKRLRDRWEERKRSEMKRVKENGAE